MSITTCSLTFFCTWEANSATEMTHWRPPISLFLSFKSIATAMQIVGMCLTPFLNSFLLSLWQTIMEANWNVVGARFFKMSAKISHVNSGIFSIGIFLNGDGSIFFLHSSLHSVLTRSRTLAIRRFFSSGCENTSLAIDGKFSPTRARPIFANFSLSIEV